MARVSTLPRSRLRSNKHFEAGRQPATKRDTELLTPQISIVRKINLKSDPIELEGWNEYLAALKRVNPQHRVAQLATMHCTLVEAGELRKMLMEKYAEIYERGNRKEIVGLHRDFGGRVRSFMGRSLIAKQAVEELTTHAERAGRDELSPAMDAKPLSSDPSCPNQWRDGMFAVRAEPRAFGDHTLGMDLSLNPTMRGEVKALRHYLEYEEDLNPAHIKFKNKEAHIGFLTTSSNIMLTPPLLPGSVPQPRFVELKLPSVEGVT